MTVSALLLAAGGINLLPIIGLAGARTLASLYEVPVHGPDMTLLLRHRALLFGILGSGMMYSAFKPAWQPAALGAGLTSMVGFALLAVAGEGGAGALNPAMSRVLRADVLGIVLAGGAAALLMAQQ